MKSENTNQEAKTEVSIGEKLKAEIPKAERGRALVSELDDEQLVLEGVLQFLRSFKRGQKPSVARWSRHWERKFNYRIQVTMQERRRRAKARSLRVRVGLDTRDGSPQRAEAQRVKEWAAMRRTRHPRRAGH